MTVAALAAGLACSRPNPAYHRDTLADGATQPLDGAPGDRPASDLPAGDLAAADLPVADLASDAGVVPPMDTAIDISVDTPPAPPPALVMMGSNPQDHQGGTGGTRYPDACPANEVLIGFRGASEDPAMGGVVTVQALSLVCGVMTAVPAAGGYSVRLTTSSSTPRRGPTGGIPFDMVCPADELVIRISGDKGAVLDKLQVHCGRLSIAGDRRTVTVQPGATLPPRGGDDGTAFDDPCPTGQVARAATIWANQVLDALVMICGTPTAMP